MRPYGLNNEPPQPMEITRHGTRSGKLKIRKKRETLSSTTSLLATVRATAQDAPVRGEMTGYGLRMLRIILYAGRK